MPSAAFGIVRATGRSDDRAELGELCRLATEASGLELRPHVATTYAELAADLERGAVAIAWLPPLPAIDLDGRQIASVLAIPARRGTTSYHAAFVVRRGGPRAIAELRGRRAAWVQKESAAGYLVPRMHLAALGFDPLRFFSRELFVHGHAAVVDAVASGEADVGATFCAIDASGKVVRGAWLDERGGSARAVEAIATMGPIPNDALVASNEVPAATRSSLTRWLLSPDDRARALFDSLLDAKDFRVPKPDHYDALRHVLRAAHARGHDSLPPDSRMRVRLRR